MQSNRGRDTTPELAVRRILHRNGYRFRVNFAPIMGSRRTADIVFTRQRVAVFIDGCFWHACPLHYVPPKSNPEYWRAKVVANRARDADTNEKLEAAGWRVLRQWEHEPPDDIAAHVMDIIAS